MALFTAALLHVDSGGSENRLTRIVFDGSIAYVVVGNSGGESSNNILEHLQGSGTEKVNTGGTFNINDSVLFDLQNMNVVQTHIENSLLLFCNPSSTTPVNGNVVLPGGGVDTDVNNFLGITLHPGTPSNGEFWIYNSADSEYELGTVPGVPGPTGPTGPTGATGPTGPTGATGPPGPSGTGTGSGSPGPPGEDGEDGIDGLPGPAGPKGAAGSAGAKGNTGPQGPPGEDGADGEDGSPGSPGPVGPRGATGSAGPTGATGVGTQGPPGEDGEDGQDGAVGPAGPIGPRGLTGTTGSAGPAGAVGSQGPPGEDGADGEDGAPGPLGPKGAAGSLGPRGVQGPQGPPGEDGVDGEDGLPGPPGPSGLGTDRAITTSATAAPNETTITTGSAAAQTLTLPTAPADGTVNTFANYSSVNWTLSRGGADDMNHYRTGNLTSIVVPSGMTVRLVYLATGSHWIVTSGGFASGSLISQMQYAPATVAAYTLTTSLAAIDTTNLTLSLTVPPSGKVKIEAQVEFQFVAAGGSGVILGLGLLNHSGGAQIGFTVNEGWGSTAAASLIVSTPMVWYLSGLTPGPLQIDIAGSVSIATGGFSGSVGAQGYTGAGSAAKTSPFTLAAYALI